MAIEIDEGSSRRHHTVPRFLLRRFADREGNLSRFDMTGDVPVSGRVNAKSATVVEDFYVLDTVSRRYDIEERETIARLEDNAAKVLRRLWNAEDLTSVWPLSAGDRNAMCAFLTSLVLRTPRFRRHTQEVAENWLKQEDRDIHPIDLFRSGVITGEPEVLAAVRRHYGVWTADEDAPPNFHAEMFRQYFNPLSKHLWDQRWILMRSDEPFLAISDNPVVLLSNLGGDSEPNFHSLDFNQSRASFTPLGRNLLLFTDWHPAEVLRRTRLNGDMVTALSAEHAKFALAMLLANADRHVFCHPEDDVIRRLFSDAGYPSKRTGGRSTTVRRDGHRGVDT